MSGDGLVGQTLASLSALQDEIINEADEVARLKKEAESASAALEAKKRKLLEMMNEAKLTSFRTARGQIVLNRTFAVKVPRGDDLDAFLGFLEKERPNDYMALRTVNYATLNSWYRIELEAAKERGDFDFSFPGIGESTASEHLSIRRS